MAIDEKKLIEDCKKYLEGRDTFQIPLEYSVAMTRLCEIIEAQPKLSLENKTSDNYVPDNNVEKMNREFEELEVTYYPDDLCTYPEYRGKPYFAIKYKENGEHFVGYGTYKPEVLSRYLRDYFMPLAMPKESKWTPFDKQLPPELEDGIYQGYIVQVINVLEPFTAYWDGEKWLDEWYDKLYGVIAWMPLPEPYKGDQNEH